MVLYLGRGKDTEKVLSYIYLLLIFFSIKNQRKQDISGTFLHYLIKSSRKRYFETVFVEDCLFSPVEATEIYLNFSSESSL